MQIKAKQILCSILYFLWSNHVHSRAEIADVHYRHQAPCQTSHMTQLDSTMYTSYFNMEEREREREGGRNKDRMSRKPQKIAAVKI